LQQVERLKQLGSAMDAKIAPLLNPEQQQKFQAVREQMRRWLIETMGSEVLHKVDGEVKGELHNVEGKAKREL
jgi:hypothetical protein